MDKRTELEKYIEKATSIIVMLFGIGGLLTYSYLFFLKFGIIEFMLFFTIALIIAGLLNYMINR